MARNAARDAALTHFIFVSDIELYPSRDLSQKFLQMIVRNEPPLNSTKPKVFPLEIFEINKFSPMPWTKTELQNLYKNGKVIRIHRISETKKWMDIIETEGLIQFY